MRFGQEWDQPLRSSSVVWSICRKSDEKAEAVRYPSLIISQYECLATMSRPLPLNLLPRSNLSLLINSHHVEPKTSGCGTELRIMGQQ